MTKEKALYQVKLILDYLPEEEYKLIPQETIDYIEDNFEYDENFTLNPDIPLEDQKIDDKAYDFLEKVVKQAEKAQKNAVEEELKPYLESVSSSNKEFDAKIKREIRKKEEALKSYMEEVKKSNEDFETKIENIRLKNIIELLKKDAEKLPQAKKICEEYKAECKKIEKDKDKEIKMLKKELTDLREEINKIPKFIRKVFIKEKNIKLLQGRN